MRQNIIAPSSIIIQSQVEQKDLSKAQFAIDRKSFATTEDYVYYLTHYVNNTKQKEGRIYFSMKDGILCANSLSPYAEKFWENIEEKIKPVVKILYQKRYLTYSSCEGHGLDFRRYIGLAFCDEDSRAYVANYINDLNIKGVSTKLHETVSNNEVVEHKATGKPTPTKNNKSNLNIDKKGEVNSFNIQFHRNYEQYFFLEIIIYDEISYKYEGVLKEFIKVYKRWDKKRNQEKSTQLLLEKLSTKSFKSYKF